MIAGIKPGQNEKEIIMNSADSNDLFTVVINDEEQYAIWPASLAVPQGWREIGFSGSMEACTAHVDEVWTDMRPRSLREAMAAQVADSAPSVHPV
ncbi:MbtH-like protein [Marinobacterium lacunae]|uniref:MbtH-like protein n=2 Tax=Marinobacterium lacunae TaxID=1232683 RepID=A0A081FVG4_9GAMM|nr:MbtH-like protein [Marinobacterium lacunae]